MATCRSDGELLSIAPSPRHQAEGRLCGRPGCYIHLWAAYIYGREGGNLLARQASNVPQDCAYVVMSYIVMAFTVTADIVTAYIVTAYIVMADIVRADIVTAYIVMADIVMADIVMACVVMAPSRPPGLRGAAGSRRSPTRRCRRHRTTSAPVGTISIDNRLVSRYRLAQRLHPISPDTTSVHIYDISARTNVLPCVRSQPFWSREFDASRTTSVPIYNFSAPTSRLLFIPNALTTPAPIVMCISAAGRGDIVMARTVVAYVVMACRWSYERHLTASAPVCRLAGGHIVIAYIVMVNIVMSPVCRLAAGNIVLAYIVMVIIFMAPVFRLAAGYIVMAYIVMAPVCHLAAG